MHYINSSQISKKLWSLLFIFASLSKKTWSLLFILMFLVLSLKTVEAIQINNVPSDFTGAQFISPQFSYTCSWCNPSKIITVPAVTVQGTSCGTGCFSGGDFCQYPVTDLPRGVNRTINIVLQPKNSAWFGVDGDMYAGGDLTNKLPAGQYIVSSSSPNSGGAAIAKCAIDAGHGQASQRGWNLSNYSNFGDGSSNCALNRSIPAPVFASFDQTGAQTITKTNDLDTNSSTTKYRTDGDFQINSSIRNMKTKDFSAVIFVNGNLSINNSFSEKQTPDISDFEPSLVFVVKGNIIFDKDTENAYGIYLADGSITDSGGDKGFTAFGSLISANSNISLYRDLGDVKNKTISSEKIIYQPQYLIKLGELLGRASYTWKEVAP